MMPAMVTTPLAATGFCAMGDCSASTMLKTGVEYPALLQGLVCLSGASSRLASIMSVNFRDDVDNAYRLFFVQSIKVFRQGL